MNDESYMDSDEIEEMPDESGIDILDVLEHIQRQLTALEKKMDMLLNRPEGERPFKGGRPFNGERRTSRPPRKPYDKPFQRFDRPPGRGRNAGEDRERGYRGGDRDRDNRESSRDNYSDRHKGGKKPGGKPRSGFGKKPFHTRFSE
ncbi:MAG: hypothetical protein LBJ21_09885 [Acidobacteriota bacterium]|nr:hypothetical protein [Acidobacteriota bacterium]